MALGLIGYRGSGKSTVGRQLAERLGWPFVDTDELIVARACKSIRDIFQQDGEGAFRDIESEIVGHVSGLSNAVIAFGGGALDREANRVMLRQGGHRLIYLRCDPAELLRRIQGDPQTAAARPNLTALMGGIDEITAVLARRDPIWREHMSCALDVTQLTPEQVVQEIASLLRKSDG